MWEWRARSDLVEGGDDFDGGGFGEGGAVERDAGERVGGYGGDWFGDVAAECGEEAGPRVTISGLTLCTKRRCLRGLRGAE
jgi:hypothetical protein